MNPTKSFAVSGLHVELGTGSDRGTKTIYTFVLKSLSLELVHHLNHHSYLQRWCAFGDVLGEIEHSEPRPFILLHIIALAF